MPDYLSPVLLIIAIVLLVAIVVLLAVTLRHLYPMLTGSRQLSLDIDTEPEVAKLQRAVSHYIDVSTVVAMVGRIEQLSESEIATLQGYPELVLRTAYVRGADIRGEALKIAQAKLVIELRELANVDGEDERVLRIERVKGLEAMIEHLHEGILRVSRFSDRLGDGR